MNLASALTMSILLSATLFANVSDDVNKVASITNTKNCCETLRTLLNEKALKADRITITNCRGELQTALSSIDLWSVNPRNQDLEKISWDLYPKFVKAYALLNGLEIEQDYQFLHCGFVQGNISEKLNQDFIDEFKLAKPIPFMVEDCDINYDEGKIGYYTEQNLNSAHTYYMLEKRQLKALKPIITSLKEPITACIGTPWRVVNIRAWETRPGANSEGPNSWHTDCMYPSVLKIMIYPYGADGEKGTTELQLSDGSFIVESEPGCWFFFKNSEIVHRGVAPRKGKRLVVEIAIVPSLEHDLTPVCAGVNARYPKLPWQYVHSRFYPKYSGNDVKGINVGGGPNWAAPDWINLEEVESSVNKNPFNLSPNCIFPVSDKSVNLVYTSHAIEHLITPTVYRVLSESYRTLKKNGNLIIKIPDYDKVVDFWRRQDGSFFNSGWGIESVTSGWGQRGVCDCLNHRAAMIVCSFFTSDNPFGPAESKKNQANVQNGYFGPVTIPECSLQELIDPKYARTPATLAREMRNFIKQREGNVKFCHQSAWSREELKDLLGQFGFEVVSFDPSEVTSQFSDIPGIDEMRDISIFCWAKKR